jgi:hypothetical protein
VDTRRRHVCNPTPRPERLRHPRSRVPRAADTSPAQGAGHRSQGARQGRGNYPRWLSKGEGPRPKGPGPGLVSPPPGSCPFGRMLGAPDIIFSCCCCCCFKAAFLARCCGESVSESAWWTPTGLNKDWLSAGFNKHWFTAAAPGPSGKLLWRSGGPMKPMMRFCSLFGVAAPLRCAGELPTLPTLPQFCAQAHHNAPHPVRLACACTPAQKHSQAARPDETGSTGRKTSTCATGTCPRYTSSR